MKKHLIFFVIGLLTLNVHAQINFESGYFIDNSNERIECFIRNVDWKNNPTEFQYRLSRDGKTQKTTIEQTKEFGIYHSLKYIRQTVKIDRSSEHLVRMSTQKDPVFDQEELFLKILVEGKANLYVYEDSNLKRYFFNVDGASIEQLVFKRYKISNQQIAKNNAFRKQLNDELACPSIHIARIEKLNYRQNSLVDLFVDYNRCSDAAFVNYEEGKYSDLFKLSFRPRINRSSLATTNTTASSSTRNAFFPHKFTFGFGVEAEWTMPFHQNKWAFFVEPTYHQFKSSHEVEAGTVSGGSLTAEVDYRSIELPLGLRHNFFLNNGGRLFINAFYIIDMSGRSSIKYKRADGSELSGLTIKSRPNIGFGIGYKHHRYSVEARYQTPRDLLGNYEFLQSDYKMASLIFGFSIL